MSDKLDNLRVESRPAMSRYIDQSQNRYSPADGQYGTYSPSTKHRFSPEVKKFSTVDVRRYSPDTNRYSPNTRRYSPETKIYSPDNSKFYSQEKIYSPIGKLYSEDVQLNSPDSIHIYSEAKRMYTDGGMIYPNIQSPKTNRFSPPNDYQQDIPQDNYLIRSESRQSRNSMDSSYSDRKKYIQQENPYSTRFKTASPLQHQQLLENVTPQSQKRFLHNLAEDPSPEELPAPIMTSSTSTLASKGVLNQATPTKDVINPNLINSPPKFINSSLTSQKITTSDSEYV